MKYTLQTVLTLGICYLVLLSGFYFFQNSLMFIPAKEMIATPESVGLAYEEHYFETADGEKLHSWFIINESSDKIVKVSHGNAGNISGRVGLAKVLHEAGFSVFMYDYRGYGKSSGKPNEKGLYLDAEAALNFLTQHLQHEERNIIPFGRSLGGPVAAYIAANFKIGGLAIDSSFINMKAIVSELYPFLPSFLTHANFPTQKYLSEIRGIPVMILHSRDDDLIGFHHGEKLFETASEPKRFIELRGGHNDSFLESEAKYLRAWQDFGQEL
ncbi:MAG: alpha/beta hydrolase [Balneolaceae bacterium]